MQAQLACLAIVSILLNPFNNYLPQSEDIFEDIKVSYIFGEEITFQVNFNASIAVQEVFLFIQPEGQTIQFERDFISNPNEIVFKYDTNIHSLRPFTQFNYWFRVILENGEIRVSESYSFDYIDNRFNWKTLEDDQLQINWYEGNQRFGQTILDKAQVGIESVKSYLPVTLTKQIRIFNYSSSDDLQTALQLFQTPSILGHTNPDLGTILLSSQVDNEQQKEFERKIAHDIMHILQYQILGQNYQYIPLWLSEGMAFNAEMYSNPDYQKALENAVQSSSILPIDSLCQSFPSDMSTSTLANAEADSFVRYLYKSFSTSELLNLLVTFKDNVSCEQGTQKGLSTSLKQLDYHWQQEVLGVDVGRLIIKNLSPYLVLLLILVITPITVILFRRKKRTRHFKGKY